MKKRLPRLKSTFNRQITRELRDLMKEFDLPYDGLLWEIPNLNQATYTEWYQNHSKSSHPRRDLYKFLQEENVKFQPVLKLTFERWQEIEDKLPDYLKHYFSWDEASSSITVDPKFLLDRRLIRRKRQEVLLDQKGAEELMVQALPPALIQHLETLSPPQLRDVKKEFSNAQKAKTDAEKAQAMKNINLIINTSLIPFGIQWVGNVFVYLHPAVSDPKLVTNLYEQDVSRVLVPLSSDIGIGVYATSVAMTLFDGLQLFSNDQTSAGEKREFLVKEASNLVAVPRRIAAILAPGIITVGYAGIAASIFRFVTVELSYQMRIARLSHDLKDSKAVLTTEVDRLLAEYQRAREFLLGLYRDQPSLESEVQQKLKQLTDYYVKAIHDEANATAKSAVTLQADQSLRRVSRVSDVVQMGLAMGANFFPPLYIGLLVTQLADIGITMGAKEYTKNSAIYNQGYQLPNVVMITDHTNVKHALKQIENLSSFTVASLPTVIRPRMSLLPKHRLAHAMNQIQSTNTFLLQLPYRINEPAMTNGAVIKAVNKLAANAAWLENVYQKIKESYDGKTPPEIANLVQLKQTLSDDRIMLQRYIDNQLVRYDAINHPTKFMIMQRNKLIAAQEKLGRMDALKSASDNIPKRDEDYYAKFSKEAREEYVNKEIEDVIHRTQQYTKFLQEVPDKKIVLNLEALLKEITDRHALINSFKTKYLVAATPIRMNEEISKLKTQVVRLRQPLNPQPEPERRDSMDQFVADQAKRLQSTQSLLRSAKVDEIRIVPANVAFGLTKRSQLRRNASKTLKTLNRMMDELPPGSKPKILIQSYDARAADNITNYRILAGRVEGLKTEIQHLRAVLDQTKGSSKYVFVDLYDTHKRYEAALDRFREAKSKLDEQPPAESRWQRIKSAVTRFLYQRSSENEIEKATRHLALLLSNIPDKNRHSTEDIITRLSKTELDQESLQVELLYPVERNKYEVQQLEEVEPLLGGDHKVDEPEREGPRPVLK